MYQYSTHDSVSNGQYDGGIQLRTLEKKGNYGIGTFDGLEGELVAVNGKFYHCKNGICTLATLDQSLAWAAVCKFDSPHTVPVQNVCYDDFKVNKIPCHTFGPQLIALQVKGLFESIMFSSTKRQEKPYPSIKEVMETSDEFELSMVEGTCVGWFAPDFCGGIKNPGFHFHFIDDSLSRGGHVLDFKCQQGSLSLFEPKSFTVEFFNLDHTLKAKQIA